MPRATHGSGKSAVSASASKSASVARRSSRIPKLSEGTGTALVAQVTSVSAASSMRGSSLQRKDGAAKDNNSNSNPNPNHAPKSDSSDDDDDDDDDDEDQDDVKPNPAKPWRHPAELDYIRRQDWSQDLMITYLCQKSFSIPKRDIGSSIPLIRITARDGSVVALPRAYRVPLMFLSAFQWDSLRLVLTAANPDGEWEEYKFDIVHLSRLCQHLFRQAQEAAANAGPKGLERGWRCPMFDRVLTRFWRKWFISRAWSIKKFWKEFDEEEYELDVLKYDWIRWSIKGHKGFNLTREEIQNGITADQFMHGLSRSVGGKWSWDPDTLIRARSVSAPVPLTPGSGSTANLRSYPMNDANAMDTITTPSHNTIQVKREHMDVETTGPFSQSAAIPATPTPTPTPVATIIPPALPEAAPIESISTIPVPVPMAVDEEFPASISVALGTKRKLEEESDSESEQETSAKRLKTTERDESPYDREQSIGPALRAAPFRKYTNPPPRRRPPPATARLSTYWQAAKRAAEKGSDEGSDGEESSDKASDGGQSSDKPSDGEQSSDKASDGEESSDKASDGEQSSHEGSGGKQSSHEGSDGEQSSHEGNDGDSSGLNYPTQSQTSNDTPMLIPATEPSEAAMAIDALLPALQATTQATKTITTTITPTAPAITMVEVTSNANGQPPLNLGLASAGQPFHAKTPSAETLVSAPSSVSESAIAVPVVTPVPVPIPASISPAIAGPLPAEGSTTITPIGPSRVAAAAAAPPQPLPQSQAEAQPFNMNHVFTTAPPVSFFARPFIPHSGSHGPGSVGVIAAGSPPAPSGVNGEGKENDGKGRAVVKGADGRLPTVASGPLGTTAADIVNYALAVGMVEGSPVDVPIPGPGKEEGEERHENEEKVEGKDTDGAQDGRKEIGGETHMRTAQEDKGGTKLGDKEVWAEIRLPENVQLKPNPEVREKARHKVSGLPTPPPSAPAPAPIPLPVTSELVPANSIRMGMAIPNPNPPPMTPLRDTISAPSPPPTVLRLALSMGLPTPRPSLVTGLSDVAVPLVPLVKVRAEATPEPPQAPEPAVDETEMEMEMDISDSEEEGEDDGNKIDNRASVGSGAASDNGSASEGEGEDEDESGEESGEDESEDEDGVEIHIPAPPDGVSPAAVPSPVSKGEESGESEGDDKTRSNVFGRNGWLDIPVRSPSPLRDREDPGRLESGGPDIGNRNGDDGSSMISAANKSMNGIPVVFAKRLNNGHASPASSALSSVPSSPLGGLAYTRPDENARQEMDVDGDSGKDELPAIEPLQNIRLLRDLIQFLRVPSAERSSSGLEISEGLEVVMDTAKASGLISGSEETETREVTVEQRLCILEEASAALAKELYPFQGREGGQGLEGKVESLDKRVQEQLVMIQRVEERFLERERVDQAAGAVMEATTGHSEGDASRPERRSQPLSPDATMVDGTFPPPHPPQSQSQSQATPATPVTVSAPPQATRNHNHSVGQTVSSMMRNMADLLEYATQDSSSSSSNKGKSRDTGPAPYPSAFSPVVSTLLDEFKTMQDEMRKSQEDHREGLEAMRVLYRSEVEALRQEVRTREDRKEREVEALVRRHEEEIGALREAIKGKDEKERERERKEEEEEARVPTLELLELRRRVASLESKNVGLSGEDPRQPTLNDQLHPSLVSPLTQFPRLSTSAVTSTTLHPHSHLHPLGHLLGTTPSTIAHFPSGAPSPSALVAPTSTVQDDPHHIQNFRPPRTLSMSMSIGSSKPGTPVRHLEGTGGGVSGIASGIAIALASASASAGANSGGNPIPGVSGGVGVGGVAATVTTANASSPGTGTGSAVDVVMTPADDGVSVGSAPASGAGGAHPLPIKTQRKHYSMGFGRGV